MNVFLKNNYKHFSKGFSLLELLLVVFVFSVLSVGAISMFDDWQKNVVNRRVAQEMKTLQNAAELYVKLNFENYETTINDVREIPLSDLMNSGFIPDSYSGLNSFRQDLRVVTRYKDDNSINGKVIEVISFANNNTVSEDRLLDVIREGGASLGLISDRMINASCCAGLITGVYGTWSVDKSDFSNLVPGLPNADNNGGLIASYGLVNNKEQEISRNYLLRVENPGFENSNRMETNLNMNSNNIQDANFIISDYLGVLDDMSVLNTSQNGNTISVKEAFNANTVNIESNNDNNKGNLSILGDGGLGDDLIVNGNMIIMLDNSLGGGQVQSNSIIIENELNVDSVAELNVMDSQDNNFVANNIYMAQTLTFDDSATINDTMQSINFESNSMSVDGNTVSAITDVSGTLSVSNNLNLSDGAIFSQSSATRVKRVTASGVTSIKDVSSCSSGCP